MITRALLAACVCACALALTPLSAAGDDNDCALYLTGPGRSSAFDYNLNLLRGNFGYDGQHTCITYEAVNNAYIEARKRIVVAQPKGDWKAEDYASVGELILDISINLARTYGLTYEEIEKGLPLIDTSRTLIREVCPPIFSHVECRAGKYRRLDGLCNNLKHPTWGATMSPFQRLIGPLFADGINAPRISHTGRDLPLSRVVSRTMHPDDGFHDHAGTIMVIAWGQFMDHDYTLTGTPLDPINRNDPEECCKRPPHLKHPYCNEIRVPDDDYFYRLWGVKCIDFVRAFPSPRPGCRLGSRVPYNTLTGALDGNTVYGVTEKFSRKLRTGYGGLLRMNPVFKEYGLKDLLPLKLDIPDEGCTRPNKNMYCFEAGEIRVNEQLVLAVMHTLMAREHNRVAQGLAAVNPHWDDETLFQEARRINIAEIQHITYNEFLPILLGKDVMEKFGLVLEKENYWDGYDETVNPDVIDSFASAAYRFGHSLLPTAVERWSKAHKFIASKRLSDLIRRPYDLYRAGVLDEYVMGLMNQVAQAMDDSITQEVTNHLFKKIGARFGMDLVSFNMQRGREFGVPGYMEFRKFCGLSGANTFQELFGSMPNETVRKYETIFEHPIDVDLWSGGVSERPLPGSMLGPTFACIIATQFSYSRRGDRFWYELPNQPSSFTPEQLIELRKARLARVICDNTDIIDTVQLYPMVLPDHELNPRVPCRSGIIPSMDFSKWAEPRPAFPSAAKQFMTDATATNPNSTAECIESTEIKVIEAMTNVTDETTIKATDIDNSNINLTISLETKSKPNKDKISKYILEKNGKDVTDTKTKGHIKNSLKRKRRSNERRSPIIVNYETIHSENNNDNPNPILLPFKSLAPIKEGGLANFNIETLHEPPTQNTDFKSDDIKIIPQLHINEYIKHPSVNLNIANEDTVSNSYENIPPINNNSAKDKETLDVKETSDELRIPKPNNDSDESRSNEDDTRNIYSQDSIENEHNKKPNDKYNDKSQHRENISNEDNSGSNEDSFKNNEQSEEINNRQSSEKEEGNYRSTEDTDRGNESKELVQRNNYRERDDRREEYFDNDSSNPIVENDKNVENSAENLENERSEIPLRDNIKHDERIIHTDSPIRSTTKRPFQDVDLQDFSFERIIVKDGQVKPLDDTNESNEGDYKENIKSEIESVEPDTTDSPLLETLNEDSGQVKVNHEEIKPVIELGDDSNSEELNDDDNNSPLSGSLKINVQEQNSNSDDGNVKQQFERIPLNYKHDDENIKEEQKGQNTEQQENDNTSEDLPEKEIIYDENLNTKFGDVTIKLPEIKLPDDVISYNYDEPEDNKDKKQLYKEKNKDEDDDENEDKETEDNDEELYNGEYYGNPQYNNDNSGEDGRSKEDADEDDDNEDLYEKFVRERFGKRGSFKSRHQPEHKFERLQQATLNPDLKNTLQKILKKTKDTTKQAEKSNDPNAGYMWTLEYGQQL